MGGPIFARVRVKHYPFRMELQQAKGSGTKENHTFESCDKAILFVNLEASVLLLG